MGGGRGGNRYWVREGEEWAVGGRGEGREQAVGGRGGEKGKRGQWEGAGSRRGEGS